MSRRVRLRLGMRRWMRLSLCTSLRVRLGLGVSGGVKLRLGMHCRMRLRLGVSLRVRCGLGVSHGVMLRLRCRYMACGRMRILTRHGAMLNRRCLPVGGGLCAALGRGDLLRLERSLVH